MLSAMDIFHTFRPVALMVLVSLALGACGVKSSPQHPTDSLYPQHYPAAQKPSAVVTGADKAAEPLRRRPGRASGIYQYPNSPAYVPPEK